MIAPRFQNFVPSFVFLTPSLVNSSIDFHDKARMIAVKIRYEMTDGMLAPKLVPSKPVRTQLLPQHSLRRSHLLPKLPRSLQNRSWNLCIPFVLRRLHLKTYPFTLPSVRPEMSHLDEYRNRIITGTATRIEPAANLPAASVYCPA